MYYGVKAAMNLTKSTEDLAILENIRELLTQQGGKIMARHIEAKVAAYDKERAGQELIGKPSELKGLYEEAMKEPEHPWQKKSPDAERKYGAAVLETMSEGLKSYVASFKEGWKYNSTLVKGEKQYFLDIAKSANQMLRKIRRT